MYNGNAPFCSAPNQQSRSLTLRLSSRADRPSQIIRRDASTADVRIGRDRPRHVPNGPARRGSAESPQQGCRTRYWREIVYFHVLYRNFSDWYVGRKFAVKPNNQKKVITESNEISAVSRPLSRDLTRPFWWWFSIDYQPQEKDQVATSSGGFQWMSVFNMLLQLFITATSPSSGNEKIDTGASGAQVITLNFHRTSNFCLGVLALYTLRLSLALHDEYVI